MPKKVFLVCLIILGKILSIQAQVGSVSPDQLKPGWQKLLLELASTYHTVVKENQVDLDSSLIYVSDKLKLSRLQIASEGIKDQVLLRQSKWFDERNVNNGIKQLSTLTGKEKAEQLILIGAFYAFEPAGNQQSNDAGLDYLSKALIECRSLNEKELSLVTNRLVGKILLKKGLLPAADSVFQNVADEYATKNDQYGQATTLQWWGLYTPVTATSTPGRLASISRSVMLFQQSGDKEEQINGLINKTYLYLLSYRLDSAYIVSKQAEQLVAAIKFPYVHYVSAALHTTTMFMGKFGEPLKYALEAVENAETLKDSIGLPYFYSYAGTLYENDNFQPETAIGWNLKSINSFQMQNEPCYLVLSNVVGDLLNQKRNKQALELIQRVYKRTPPKLSTDYLFYYLSLGVYFTDKESQNWNEAFVNLTKADSVEKEEEKKGFDIRKAAITFAFANLYMEQQKYKEARGYLEQFLSQRSNISAAFIASARAWEKLIVIDSILGNKGNLVNDYKHLVDAINENYVISKSKLAEELQVRYATEEKDDQIKLLTQKDQLVQDNFKKATQVRNITIIGILLSLIIAALLYRQNKLKQKSNDVITQKNKLLERMVEEKEWLVKEIHHRVKNNLHTVICLLESQAAYLDNDALKAIETIQRRIYSMSLIHQKLYQSEDIKIIDMGAYLTEFVHYLVASFGSPENIHVSLHVDDIKLGVAQAIPAGLIINEAVSNSFKYGFPNQRKGSVTISLKRSGDCVLLAVSDDGIGLKEETGHELNSLGLELIKGLGKDLHGNVSFEINNGTTIKLEFLIDHVTSGVEQAADSLQHTMGTYE